RARASWFGPPTTKRSRSTSARGSSSFTPCRSTTTRWRWSGSSTPTFTPARRPHEPVFWTGENDHEQDDLHAQGTPERSPGDRGPFAGRGRAAAARRGPRLAGVPRQAAVPHGRLLRDRGRGTRG